MLEGEYPKMINVSFFFVFILIACASCDSASNDKVEAYYFKQPVDHFNADDKRTWHQKYYVNNKFYKDGGPAFINVGGESTLSPEVNHVGITYDHAKEHNGILFNLEHRYFGASHPFNDMSDKNITFLTMNQAVADVAEFIKGMTRKYNMDKNTKWIPEGCSYAGTVVALLRIKHPEIAFGGISYSGPVEFSLNFADFYQVAENVYKEYSQSCLDILAESRKDIVDLAKTPSGAKTLHDKFKICDSFDENNFTQKDVHFMIYTIYDELVSAVQFLNIQRGNHSRNVGDVCRVMTDENEGTRIDRLAKVYEKFRILTGDECLHLYGDYVDIIKNSSVKVPDNGNVGLRQWKYLQCTGWGYCQTSDKATYMFGNETTLDFYMQLCADVFLNWTKELLMKEWSSYKSVLDNGLPRIKNMIYYWGGYDPWQVSAYKTTDPTSRNIFVKDASHCAVAYEESADDPPSLKAARKEISDVISDWLKR